jgi:hypothetical protein
MVVAAVPTRPPARERALLARARARRSRPIKILDVFGGGVRAGLGRLWFGAGRGYCTGSLVATAGEGPIQTKGPSMPFGLVRMRVPWLRAMSESSPTVHGRERGHGPEEAGADDTM